MDSRNLYLYWVGKEYNLIKLLRELIQLHSTHGKGYKVHLITDQNIQDYVSRPDYFHQLCPAHQADFVRVHVICEYGGIWLDSDTLVIDSLDTLFDKLDSGNGFFLKENNATLFNGVFGSRKQTPLMLEWKNQLIHKLNAKHEKISWCEIGNEMLQTIYQQQSYLYQDYEIMNGLDTMYPVNWCNCVHEYLEKPYEHYKNLIRPYQPLVVLVNSVYKALESKSVDEIRNGRMPLNYFIHQSYETIHRSGPSIKKYVLITPWIKDYITLEHYTFAKNLTYFGWELIEIGQKEIPSTEKCILLCITYDDLDLSVYQRDHIFLIYKIDDLFPYKPIRNTCIHSSDLIIGPYQYLFHTKEIENLYGNIVAPQLHIPYSAVNEFYQSCVFNSNPILKIFISGCDNPSIYPFRHYMYHHPPLTPYIECLPHPEYSSYTHDTINKKYYETLNQYLCCFTDATNYKYILLKVFEIGSVGSLLLVHDMIEEELSKLGFYDQVNCILCNPSNVQQKIEFILNPENRNQIDEIRMKGMNLVRERHHTFQRAFDFNSKIEDRMFTIKDKIVFSSVFVIHLARSQRESSFKKNIKNARYDNVYVFDAVDGYDMTSVNKAMSLFQNLSIDHSIRKGELGCLLSHLKLLKHIVDHNIQKSTIFEDDICFHPDWNRLYNLYYESTPKNYDMIFIGNQLDSCRKIDLMNSTPLITTEPVFCTHAYMITLEGARKLLNSLIHWDYAHFVSWDNKRFTGLTAIDVMIKDIQHKTLHGIMQQPFIWYSWNGTKYPCDYNQLPVTEKTCKNTGLVFQDSELTSLIVGSTPYENPITSEPIKHVMNKIMFTNPPVIKMSVSPETSIEPIKHDMNKMMFTNPHVIKMSVSPETSIEPIKLTYTKPHVSKMGLLFSSQEISRNEIINTPEPPKTYPRKSRISSKMKFHAFTHLSL